MIGGFGRDEKEWGSAVADENKQGVRETDGLQQKGLKTFDRIMKQILDLGQSSLSESQFQAFRKLTMDYFADGKRSFLENRQKGNLSLLKL
ncbi:MAG TPA: hypothetical protein DF383_05680 [Deltaproteobacteria bacterium]|nr:hypothetical protein [Deltaproteobacteria bacterium]